MLTKQKLTTSIGYVKYRSRAEARRVAKKLDLQGTHSHQMEVNGMTRTIYMPSNSHSALNAELRKRGLPKTMVPVSGTRDMGSGGSSMDRMEMGMTGGGGMMPGPSSSPSAESMPGDLEGDDMLNMERMVDAGIEPEDEMSLDDGMFDMELGDDESPKDPMGLSGMGMEQELMRGGSGEVIGDEDDDDEMEIY